MSQKQQSTFTGIGAGSTQVILGPQGFTGSYYIYGLVASTQTFRLDLQISADGGTTWTTAKSISGAAGQDATYGQAAEISQYTPNLLQIVYKNTSVSSANIVYDIRPFQISQR